MNRIAGSISTEVKPLFLTPTARRHGLVGRPELWKIKRDFQIGYLKSVGLEPRHHLLDIGCGTLRGGIPLIAYLDKGHYFGIESRGVVLAEGRNELKESNLEEKEPALLVATDLGTLELAARFEYMWAFSVMIHMNDEIAERCLSMVGRHLEPEGRYYANVNIGERPEGGWQGFPVVYRSLDFYRSVAAKCNLDVEDVGDLKSLGHDTGIEEQDSQRMLRFRKL